MLGTYLLTGALVAVTLFAAFGPITSFSQDDLEGDYDDAAPPAFASLIGCLVVGLLTVALWPFAIGLLAWKKRGEWSKSWRAL